VSLEAGTTSPGRDRQVVDWVLAGGVFFIVAPAIEASAEGEPRGAERRVSLAELLGLRVRRGSAPAAPVADDPLASLAALHEEEAAQHWSAWPRGARIRLGQAPHPVLVDFVLGRGRVVALAEPSFLRNEGLAEGDRLSLALALLLEPGRTIVFDEHAHGLAERPGLAYVLSRYGLLPALGAFLLFLGLVAWRTSPAEAEPVDDAGAMGEMEDTLIHARAALYARTIRPHEALRVLERDLRHRLSERLGSPRPLAWPDLERRLAERPALASRLRSAVAEVRRLRARPPLRLDDTLPMARRLFALIEEIR
jgi:hypothetical protein